VAVDALPGPALPRPPDRPAGPPAEGFGVRAEKLLRVAEQDAAEIRSRAAQEAVALLELTRAEADAQRHQVEQVLLARVAELNEALSRRAAEVEQRERECAERLTAGRAEVELLREIAVRDAERLRREAVDAADELRREAETSVRAIHDRARDELARLTALTDDVRAELARAAALLRAELGLPEPQ
jgi:hypothetical protein